MDIVSTYFVKIKEHNHVFKESIEQYHSAVRFFCRCLFKGME